MRWTVVVCTFNRAPDLAEALERLGALTYPPGEYEILVVENACTDETPAIIAAAAAKNGAIRSISEGNPGLSHARNAGIAAARGDLIAFLDDDAWPEPDWLQRLEAAFDDDSVGCAGGKVEPVWPGEARPDWLPERFVGFFSVVDYGNRPFLRYPDYPAGTNIAFRKSALRKAGPFRTDLGRVGAQLLSMEEVDLCLRMEEAGYRVAYRADAVVHHKIPAQRLVASWMLQRLYCQGLSAALLERTTLTGFRAALKLAAYLLFVAIAAPARVLFDIIGNRKMAFFCHGQSMLCRAYLKEALRRR